MSRPDLSLAGERVQRPGGVFVFRRIVPDADVPRLVALDRALAESDQTGETPSAAEIARDLASPGYDVSQDGWVVEDPDDPDRLIAEGWSYRVLGAARADLGIKVHPAWRRQGLGTELLRRAQARAAAQGAHYVYAWAQAGHPAAAPFLHGFGFAPEQTMIRMRFPADRGVDLPVVAAGYTVRPYPAVDDVTVLTCALNQGFTGHWENRERTDAEIAARLARPDSRPDGIFLAFGPAGDVAGVCWARLGEAGSAGDGAPAGEIASLGIVPAHRRQGLGHALLLTGMAWLRAEGQAAIELDVVGDNDGALRLYRDAGFGPVREKVAYRRAL